MDNDRNAKKVRPIIRLDFKVGSLVEPKLYAILGVCQYWSLEENIKDVVITAMRMLNEKNKNWNKLEVCVNWSDPDFVTSHDLEVLYYWITGLEKMYPVIIDKFGTLIKDKTHRVEMLFAVERKKFA